MRIFSTLLLTSMLSIAAFANAAEQSGDRETYALSRTQQNKCSANAATFTQRKFRAERGQLKFDEVFCEGAFSRRNGKPYVACMLYPQASAGESHFVSLLDPTCRRSFAAFAAQPER
jgi:hypothetical protein